MSAYRKVPWPAYYVAGRRFNPVFACRKAPKVGCNAYPLGSRCKGNQGPDTSQQMTAGYCVSTLLVDQMKGYVVGFAAAHFLYCSGIHAVFASSCCKKSH